MSNAIDFALGYNLAPMRSSGREAVALNQGVMDRMSAGVNGLGAQWQKFAGLIGVGFLVGAAQSLADFAGEIRDLSDTTGLSTDMFQRYSFAVSQSGGSQAVFSQSIIAIQQAQQSAITGNEKAIASFAVLGITFADLQRLSPDQLFLAFADAIKNSGASAESFAALAELVGKKVATKLLPSLKLGSDGFVELGKAAGVASQEAINFAESAGDEWNTFLTNVKTGALDAISVLNDFGNKINEMGGGRSLDLEAKTKAFDKAYVPMPLGFDPMSTDRMGPTMQDFQPGVVEGFEQFGPSREDLGIVTGPSAEEKAIADERQKAAEDIYAIEQKIALLKLETGREQMSQYDLIKSLEAERAALLFQSENLSNSPLAASRVRGAQAKLEAEQLGNRISKVQKNFQAGVATGEQFGPTLKDLGIRNPRMRGGGATSQGAGGLVAGGAAYLERVRGMGLGRPSSITHRGGPEERMAGDMRELLTIWKRN